MTINHAGMTVGKHDLRENSGITGLIISRVSFRGGKAPLENLGW